MAWHSATFEVKTLMTAGYTLTDIENEVGVSICYGDTKDTFEINGLTDLDKLERFTAEHTDTRFIKRNGEWHIRGLDLTPGEIAEVSKRNGTITNVTVNEIVDTDGPFKIASIVSKARKPRKSACEHIETSNTGQCYSCGAYVANDDLASVAPRGYRNRGRVRY